MIVCERTKHMNDPIKGKYIQKCGRRAVTFDRPTKRYLCLSCYNKHLKKLNKSKIIYLDELK